MPDGPTGHEGALSEGLLSVIIPLFNSADYLDECLASLTASTVAELEIIVVNDGSTDDSAEIVGEWACRDGRIRVLEQSNRGAGAARNLGIARARGEFLTFLDSDDAIEPDAYAEALEALRASGSDLAVLGYDRLSGSTRQPAAPWIREAHRHRRLGICIADLPELMVNAVVWSKVFRRSFWDRSALRFPEGVKYEDQPVSIRSYVLAEGIDVLTHVGVHWRKRLDRSSASQQVMSVRNLEGQIAATESTLATLTNAGLGELASIRAEQLLAYNMPNFTRSLPVAEPGFWPLLRTTLPGLIATADPERYRQLVTAQDKVLNHLVVDDREPEALAFLQTVALDTRVLATKPADGGIAIVPPAPEGIPPSCLLLADRQLALHSALTGVRWQGAGVLHVEGHARLGSVDLSQQPTRIAITLVGPTGQEIAMAVEPACQTSNHTPPPAPGAFRAHLDVSSAELSEGDWGFQVSAQFADVLREGAFRPVPRGRAGAVTRANVVPGGLAYRIARGPDGVPRVEVRRPAATLTGQRVVAGVLELEFLAEVTPSTVALVHPSRLGGPVRAQPVACGGGSWIARIPLPAATREAWGTETTLQDLMPARARIRSRELSKPELILATSTTPASVPWDRDELASRPASRHAGTAQVELYADVPVLTSYSVESEWFSVTVQSGRSLAAATPVLRLGRTGEERCGEQHHEPGGSLVWRFRMAAEDGRNALEPGAYVVGMRLHAAGPVLPVPPAAHLLDEPEREHPTPSGSASVQVRGETRPALVLALRS